MNQDIIEEYATVDIEVAAVLKYSGHVLDRISLNGTKGIFYFLNVEKDLLMDLDLGKYLIEPRGYYQEVRNLASAVKRMTRY